MPNIEYEKTGKKTSIHSDSIPIETKTLEDVRCGNCGLPLLIHVFWRGEKYERIVECKKCEISFSLEGNHKPIDTKANPVGSNVNPIDAKTNPAKEAKPKPAKKSNDDKKESMVDRLVRSW
ncbi:MAG: hypothetical protein WED07_05215 [Candidatus Freyarchaeum deiterrae]